MIRPFTLADLDELSSDTFATEEEGFAFALGTLAGMNAAASTASFSADTARDLNLEVAATVLDALHEALKEAVAERLATIQTAREKVPA